jgi:hypothetical protein
MKLYFYDNGSEKKSANGRLQDFLTLALWLGFSEEELICMKVV